MEVGFSVSIDFNDIKVKASDYVLENQDDLSKDEILRVLDFADYVNENLFLKKNVCESKE
nr:MAG TPA: hypothetical protein [Caudoviricetes sp.]